ncbi:MAG: glycoside hydrolase family 127 protein [Clostridia bacterium]|nr:glycoside hydrolase family 127 protein [Clostridia bacterium]
MDQKHQISFAASAPTKGVKLTGGRFKRAFDNNIRFLKGFDLDRILYYYRLHAGKPAPSVPYAYQSGHFECNLKGQTAGEFLMGACTTLLWQEDEHLRSMANAVVSEIDACKDEDGFLLPITREEWHTKEYPNYTRAWVTFGLLDAGYAGNERAFELARMMGDFFNKSDLLPYVKDMNLGFQGILANTRLYDSPAGVKEDVDVAISAYEEKWWLEQVIAGDHRAIYSHPGNHPHSTLLTTLEGYFDLYRATGNELYLRAVRSALAMYESKWQHVGGGINMCEFDTYWPGCNWLSMKHNYNELCSTNFWVLLNQRMLLLEPDNSHYADEIENSIYNVLLAAQVGSQGYHYLNFLEGGKDARYLDRCTCCASLGTRLVGLLPQFLYSTAENTVYVNLYASSEAALTLSSGDVHLTCDTLMPDSGSASIHVDSAAAPFTLKLRIPRWTPKHTVVCINKNPVLTAAPGCAHPGYAVLENVRQGDTISFDLSMGYRVTKYTGGEELVGKDRCALEYGPLLYAAMGPSVVHVSWDVNHPECWFERIRMSRKLRLKGDPAHEYWPYIDIHDEPFSVYPVVLPPR